MRTCCVCGTSVVGGFHHGSRVALHRFPRDEELSNTWARNINRRYILERSVEERYHMFVCSRHFELGMFPHQLFSSRLKKNAFPTLFNLEVLIDEPAKKRKKMDVSARLSRGRVRISDLRSDFDLNTEEISQESGKVVNEITVGDVNVEENLLNISEIMVEPEENNSEHSYAIRYQLQEQDIRKPHLCMLLNDVTIKGEQTDEATEGEQTDEATERFRTSNEGTDQYIFDSSKFYRENNKVEVCRICLKPTHDNSIKFIDQHHTISIAYKDMVKFVSPNMNLDLYPEPVMCIECATLLAHTYEFKKKSSVTEAALQKYMTKKRLTKSPVNSDGKSEGEFHWLSAYSVDKMKIKMLEDDYMHERENLPPKKTPEFPSMDDNLLDKKFNKYFSRTSNHAALKQKLRKLRRRMWGEAPYLCDICGHIFNKFNPFKKHLYRHKIQKETVESFTCDICNFTFTNVNINLHYGTHKQKKFKCELCDREFLYSHHKVNHIKRVHENPLKINGQCDVCGKIMKRSSIPFHLTYHNLNNKKYKCHICNDNKTFFKHHLKEHLKKHVEPVEESVCHICGKVMKYDLKKHIERHMSNECNNKGRYKCEICDKTFIYKKNLKRHFINGHVKRER